MPEEKGSEGCSLCGMREELETLSVAPNGKRVCVGCLLHIVVGLRRPVAEAVSRGTKRRLEDLDALEKGDGRSRHERYRCSFCGKHMKQVKKLVAGPDVYICDGCVDLCNEIILEELDQEGRLVREEGEGGKEG